jgi:hypothetical protein
MYSKSGTLITILLFLFPFFTLGLKLFEDSVAGGVVYTLIVVGLILSMLIALGVKLTEDTQAPDPAPPVVWDWDGVRRVEDD